MTKLLTLITYMISPHSKKINTKQNVLESTIDWINFYYKFKIIFKNRINWKRYLYIFVNSLLTDVLKLSRKGRKREPTKKVVERLRGSFSYEYYIGRGVNRGLLFALHRICIMRTSQYLMIPGFSESRDPTSMRG